MDSEIQIRPQAAESSEAEVAEARAKIFREIEAETRADRARKENARHKGDN